MASQDTDTPDWKKRRMKGGDWVEPDASKPAKRDDKVFSIRATRAEVEEFDAQLEAVGLIKPLRDTNGYRAFRESEVQKLAFLGRARTLGFTIEDCRSLLQLWEKTDRESADVKRIAEEHLTTIEDKIAELTTMHASLTRLVEACAGDHRPDCPILLDLAAEEVEPEPVMESAR